MLTAKQRQSSSDQVAQLHFATDFMPDVPPSIITLTLFKFPSISNILCKSPWKVQECAAAGLEKLCSSDSDPNRKARAKYNLACVYVEGLGVEYDLSTARDLIVQAAHLGHDEARTLYINAFSSIDGSESVDTRTWEDWVQSSAENGDAIASVHLKNISPAKWAEAWKTFLLKHTMWGGSESSLATVTADDLPYWTSWRRSFLYCTVVDNLLEFVIVMLKEEPSLLEAPLNSVGQTALLTACQFGHTAIVKYLIEEGASVTKADKNDITPLHWLTAFEVESKSPMAVLLNADGSNLNAWANIDHETARRDSYFRVGPLMSGTPLHWAVACGDAEAVDILIGMGSDPLYHQTGSMSAFEVACCLSNSSIIRRFLQETIVTSSINDFRPLQDGYPVLVRPLFFVVRGESRWNRLVRHGGEYEAETRETIRLLTLHGASIECVLKARESSMSATFATALHDCNADVMKSGLQYGFRDYIDSTMGNLSSGGNALFLAITHRRRDLFLLLLENGANIHAEDSFRLKPLHRAAKENDDCFFAEKLLQYGASVDGGTQGLMTPFFIATYTGNLGVAKFLYENGADRESFVDRMKRTILGHLIGLQTKNAADRIKFILDLPDRLSDGFIVFKPNGHEFSAFHAAVPMISEDLDRAEIARLIMSILLEKYSDKRYLDSTDGPHHDTALGMATEVGNYKVVSMLLKAGANPNIKDEYGRTPLDKLYWRYCYPSLTVALTSVVDINDRLEVGRILEFVNRNTSEVLSLLKSHGAEPNVFQFPAWFQNDSGYRTLDWVMQRLAEDRSADRQASDKTLMESGKPVWGDLPIEVPDKPMQFSAGDRG
jgi:ankyrin repeat protein